MQGLLILGTYSVFGVPGTWLLTSSEGMCHCVPRPRYRCERFRGELSRADAASSSSRQQGEGDKGEKVTAEKVRGANLPESGEVRICSHRDKQSGNVRCCQLESESDKKVKRFLTEESIWQWQG